MNFLKKVFIISLLCCLSSMTASAKNNQTGKYLFIASANLVEIHKDKNKPLGNYVITLKKVDPWVIYFSNRPKRDMGFMPIEDFLAKMGEEGEKFTPKGLNAAVVSLDSKKKIVKYVFTLCHPQSNSASGTVTFIAHVLSGKTAAIVPSEIEFKHVALFIDACVGCVGPP